MAGGAVSCRCLQSLVCLQQQLPAAMLVSVEAACKANINCSAMELVNSDEELASITVHLFLSASVLCSAGGRAT